MSDRKRITGLAETPEGKRHTVVKTVREGDNEIIEDFEMRMMLAWACEEQGMHLVEVQEIAYVQREVDTYPYN